MTIDSNKRCGLYIHVPFCARKCFYCGFYSEPIDKFEASEVVSAIIKEVDSYGAIEPETIYIGGGSPSCLPIEQLGRLVERCSGFGKVEEFTVEVNPSQVNEDMLRCLFGGGVNRLSIGAQSFNENDLAFLGRGHSADDIMAAVEAGRGAGFENISLDLIFALPGADMHRWANSLNAAMLLDVEHISAYSLSYEKGTPLFTAMENGDVTAVDEEVDRGMYDMCIDVLGREGYGHYEVSNFAKEGYQCRHNVGYWKMREYVGAGPAAGSYIGNKRLMNMEDAAGYVKAIETGDSAVSECVEVSGEDAACERMVLGLRMTEGVDLVEYAECTGYKAEEVFGEVIAKHVENGLMEAVEGRVRLTREGLPVADRVLCDFASM